ncbi:protein-disulfide reductase DsbD domain-containing protein [Tenacibaculum finnmarkense]|uniref:protein-disulfide reductase DsbD domain-containing protein n=1 Tax=Tenacibaculum finnmarkense TaxID=2781243 RepID=UPI00187B55B5|nr:protein-disulfide reductase DsbD domain-containing protein [Tenacibaculum finnmarkense]MBE7645968.1 cytochrome C biogenesis protein [Tenacibaculum finnmarkense genomovar ulcerans]MBE7648901.1 cytochrome C biogenesis protein [Tenacibaculum finnmarkense genomovar ulcerans]MBE7688360.1 cytochrome C biogenesis protein [Tenacibaculum finnmarkense genomovar ulcerans]MCD8400424.1 protein-disulfide reductase DsbD N-terminal domain-containing protein [Tenacibaculum finnmarkense genomovar ulcerans]MC
MSKLLTALSFLLSFVSYGQLDNPIKWTTSVEKISEKESELIVVATLDEEWHIYSQKIASGGPIPTLFSFTGDQRYLKQGVTKEGAGQVIDDEIFEMRIKYFDNTAVFTQRIRLKTNEKFVIKGTVEYMVCSNETCFPPEEVTLSFKIN